MRCKHTPEVKRIANVVNIHRALKGLKTLSTYTEVKRIAEVGITEFSINPFYVTQNELEIKASPLNYQPSDSGHCH